MRGTRRRAGQAAALRHRLSQAHAGASRPARRSPRCAGRPGSPVAAAAPRVRRRHRGHGADRRDGRAEAREFVERCARTVSTRRGHGRGPSAHCGRATCSHARSPASARTTSRYAMAADEQRRAGHPLHVLAARGARPRRRDVREAGGSASVRSACAAGGRGPGARGQVLVGLGVSSLSATPLRCPRSARCSRP